MKITLLFLLLINLLFYGWSQWVAEPPGAALVATPEPAGESLTLFAEAYPELAAAELDVTTLEAPAAEPEADEDVVAVAPVPTTSTESSDTPPVADVLADVAETPPPAIAQAPPEVSPQAPPDPPQTQTAAIVATPERCVALGPFLRLREATEAAARLRESGLEPSQRLEESEIWVGHWVYLPAFASRAAAIAQVEELRAGGITDNYIEPSGELRNTISLGLFNDRGRAEARAEEARALGTSPEIRDRYRNGSVYWLDFGMGPDQAVDVASFSSQPGRPVELNERDCATAGG